MVFEKATIFFGKVRKRLGEKSEKLREIKLEDIAKFAAKEAAGAIPVVGPIIKGAFDEFLPDEKEELLKELNELSESQFKEIGEKVGVSVEYLMDIREITLYSFGELQADHEEIKELIRSLIEIITRVEITIPSIQSVLEKDEIPDGEFSRTEPKWIDFEEDFVVEREEVDEIINKLENNNIQLVLGKPASGKSVILKNIGFKLAKKGRSVYIIELKKWSADRVESYFKEAQKIDDERTLIIVDDAHLPEKLSKCEELIRDYRYKKLRTKLIIGSRDVKEIMESRTEEFSTEESEFKKFFDHSPLNEVLTEIHAIDATKKMIYLFLTEEYRVRGEHLIETVSRGLEEYKHDLWYLSWALKAYDKDTDTVNKEKIYSAIAKKIEKINGEAVLLPLSVFYRFEIPIERDFLEEQLEIEEDKINQLIELSEIIETEGIEGNEMLSLNHSSIADLYFKTYKARKSLGRKTKKKIIDQRDEDLEYCLFYKYMTSTDPRNAIGVVISLSRRSERVIEDLIEDKRVKDSIAKGIEKEEDIESIGWCVHGIAEINFRGEVAKTIVNHIDIDTLISKIEKEQDIWKIKSCVGSIADISREIAKKIVNRIDIDTLISKIEKEEEIGKIGWCVSSIAKVSKKVVREIVNRIDIDTLISKIEKEQDIRIIGPCVGNIAKGNGEVALKLADSVSSKIEKEEDLWNINSCVGSIAEVSGEVAREIVNRIDIDTLLLRIEKEQDIIKIGWCVHDIAEVSKKVVREIVNRIDIDTLISKIEKEQDIEKIARCVGSIVEISGEVAKEIVNRINIDTLISKIEKEQDIRIIGPCVGNIAKGNGEVALKLADSVSSKIEKEEDIEKIGWFVNSIARGRGEVGQEIVNRIDIDTLLSKIEKEEDIEKVRWCVQGIAEVSKEVALKLADSVSSKIEKEEDMGKIGWCVHSIAEVSGEVVREIVNRIDIDTLISKIEKEQAIGKIGQCVGYIRLVAI